MITFENIRIEFGDFVAVPDFNLTIEKGEFFTLLGPSGCGKTTVLRSLAGLNSPSRGRIIIEGKDVTKLPSDKRQVGMVFQNYALFPSMSVASNIGYGLKVAKTPKDELQERVQSMAQEVGLSPMQLRKQVGELSGGQQQRVAIARALIMRPKILLLDEPLSNLDAKLRGQLRIQLKEMQEHFGVTSLYVTHDQEEALTMSDRLAVLDQGQIEQVGTPREIYSQSTTEFVCRFIGEANQLSSQTLAAAGFDAVSDDRAYYIRMERLKIHAGSDHAEAGGHCLPGVIVANKYQGTTSIPVIEIDGGERLQALVKEDGSWDGAVGDRVVVQLPAEALLSYPKGSES